MLRGEVSGDFVRTIAADPEGSLDQIGVGVKHITLEDYPNAHTYFPQERFATLPPGFTGTRRMLACMTPNA
jgi:hypothetical protein